MQNCVSRIRPSNNAVIPTRGELLHHRSREHPDGESTHEYFVPSGVVVLDDDVIHQLYFVTLKGRRSGSLTLLAPRTGAQAVASLENQGAASVEIGGSSIAAAHFVLSAAGFSRRDFWIDSAGRVLRAAIPDRGLVAQRDELPR